MLREFTVDNVMCLYCKLQYLKIMPFILYKARLCWINTISGVCERWFIIIFYAGIIVLHKNTANVMPCYISHLLWIQVYCCKKLNKSMSTTWQHCIFSLLLFKRELSRPRTKILRFGKGYFYLERVIRCSLQSNWHTATSKSHFNKSIAWTLIRRRSYARLVFLSMVIMI